MTPSTRHPLSVVLGKAKVGGLVLAATVLIAGTAEAAAGGDLVVGSEPDPTVVEQPTGDRTDNPTNNHGENVSGVAHSVPPGPGHGAAVAAAARSDCGKPDSAGADEPSTADDPNKTKTKKPKKSKPVTSAPGGGASTAPGQTKHKPTSSTPGNSGHAGDSPGNSGHAPGHSQGKGQQK